MDISQKIQKLYEQTGISPEVHDFGEKIEKSLKERFDKIDKMAELNQLKVIHAMQEARVNAECFNYASGYGYNDFGRDTLAAEGVYRQRTARLCDGLHWRRQQRDGRFLSLYR